jgi:DNA-binding transcriptional MerR regulator
MNQLAEKQTVDDGPMYNIGAVSRMTGIAIATLRAWERRYGFPEAGRTSGGHRLYTLKDVQSLHWIKQHIDQGMHVSHAIRALRQSPVEDSQLQEMPSSPTQAVAEPLTMQPFQERLTQALIRYDTPEADQVLGEALLLYNLDDVVLDAIAPTMAEIGQAWFDKRIDVTTEHLATNYLRHRLTLWIHSSPPPRPAQPVALACAPGELHEGSLLILSVLLRRRRWPVSYWGQMVPLADVAGIAREIKPQVVVLVAMTEETATALAEWPTWLPDVFKTGRPIIGYGGRIFSERPEWRERVPGIFLGTTLKEGLQNLELMLQES